jgi:chemotaxis protein CheX
MSQLDAAFFKPFVEGTKHILKVSCQLEAVPGKPFVKKKGNKSELNVEIAGVIGLTSSNFTGTITLCFPAGFYLTMMSNMLGEEFKEITDDLQDGAAELLNMIFGHAKVLLNQQGHTIQKAIPTVIRGSNLQTTHMGNSLVMVLPFSVGVGEFNIEICAEDQK